MADSGTKIPPIVWISGVIALAVVLLSKSLFGKDGIFHKIGTGLGWVGGEITDSYEYIKTHAPAAIESGYHAIESGVSNVYDWMTQTSDKKIGAKKVSEFPDNPVRGEKLRHDDFMRRPAPTRPERPDIQSP